MAEKIWTKTEMAAFTAGYNDYYLKYMENKEAVRSATLNPTIRTLIEDNNVGSPTTIAVFNAFYLGWDNAAKEVNSDNQ